MEPNYGVPLGAPMPADQRRGYRQWQPVGALAVAASILVGLTALLYVLETVAEMRGLVVQGGLFAIGFLLALVTAAVVFIVWLWRARANAELIAGPQSQRLGRGWGIGSWFIPIGNLRLPYKYVVDVWRASGPDRENSGDALVLAWWLTFIAANIVARFARYDAGHTASLVSALLLVAAAVLAVLMIRKITAWQSAPRA